MTNILRQLSAVENELVNLLEDLKNGRVVDVQGLESVDLIWRKLVYLVSLADVVSREVKRLTSEG